MVPDGKPDFVNTSILWSKIENGHFHLLNSVLATLHIDPEPLETLNNG